MKKELLTQLYKEYASIIYRYLLKHGCRKEVAEELVHESFVKTIEHFEDVDPEKLSAWVFIYIGHAMNLKGYGGIAADER